MARGYLSDRLAGGHPVAWSPDGRWIAYVGLGPKGFTNVFVASGVASPTASSAAPASAGGPRPGPPGELPGQLVHGQRLVEPGRDVPAVQHRAADRDRAAGSRGPHVPRAEVPRGPVPRSVPGRDAATGCAGAACGANASAARDTGSCGPRSREGGCACRRQAASESAKKAAKPVEIVFDAAPAPAHARADRRGRRGPVRSARTASGCC